MHGNPPGGASSVGFPGKDREASDGKPLWRGYLHGKTRGEAPQEVESVASSVLLVDDNPVFLRILSRFLTEQSDGEVRVVGTVLGGRDAAAEAFRLRPDIIVLDLQMGDVSGLELLPRLRAQPLGAHLIVLTFKDAASHRSEVLEAGADAFVEKACLERDLLPVIRRLEAQDSRHPGTARL